MQNIYFHSLSRKRQSELKKLDGWQSIENGDKGSGINKLTFLSQELEPDGHLDFGCGHGEIDARKTTGCGENRLHAAQNCSLESILEQIPPL